MTADHDTHVDPEQTPTPFDLWCQAEGDPYRYRELMVEYGHLVPGEPRPLPCGWSPEVGDGH